MKIKSLTQMLDRDANNCTKIVFIDGKLGVY